MARRAGPALLRVHGRRPRLRAALAGDTGALDCVGPGDDQVRPGLRGGRADRAEVPVPHRAVRRACPRVLAGCAAGRGTGCPDPAKPGGETRRGAARRRAGAGARPDPLMDLDPARLRRGELLAGTGGVLLLVFLVAGTWSSHHGTSRTGWQLLTHLRWLLLVTSVAAIALAVA